MSDNELTGAIIGAAIEVHRHLGPGLLESAYEECLFHELLGQKIRVERQKPVPVVYKGQKLECGYRMDLLVEGHVVVELKSVENLTYMKLSECRLGLLINFNVELLKDGVRRFIL